MASKQLFGLGMDLLSSEVQSSDELENDNRLVRFENLKASKSNLPSKSASKSGSKVGQGKKSRSKYKSKSKASAIISKDIIVKEDGSVLNIYDPHLHEPVIEREIKEYKDSEELRRLRYCQYRQNTLKILQPIIAESDDNLSPRALGLKYRDIFGRIKCVMIDLSGTLYTNNIPTQYADQAVARLRNLGLKIMFLSNASNESTKMLFGRLRNLGFDIKDKELYTSVMACNEFLLLKEYRPFYLVEEIILEDFSPELSQERPTVVVVGSKPRDVGYAKLTKTIAMLRDGAELIGIQKVRQYETENGLELGAGPFIESLEFTTGKSATIIGKPEKQFFDQALAFAGWKSEETVMIGDDAFEDVVGASNAGIKTILVKTGKYKQNDELRINPISPDYITRNFAYGVRCIEAAISVKQGIPIDSSYLDPVKSKIFKIDLSDQDFMDKMNTYMNPCLFDKPCPATSTLDLLIQSDKRARASFSRFSTGSEEPTEEMPIKQFAPGKISKANFCDHQHDQSCNHDLKIVDSINL